MKYYLRIATTNSPQSKISWCSESHPTRMNELMSHCQSWLPDPSVHPSSNSTTKQWYQKWIMGDLWGWLRRVICQKTIRVGNNGNRPLWRSVKKKKKKKKKKVERRENWGSSQREPFWQVRFVIDCQWKSLWQWGVCLITSRVFADSFWRRNTKWSRKKKHMIDVVSLLL